MQAIFLTAGENSRMFPLDKITHKGLIFIHGRPLIEYAMEKLSDLGISEFIVVLGQYDYAEEIKQYFQNKNFNIKFSTQISPLGQANAILSAREYINSDIVIVDPYYLGEDEVLSEMLKKFRDEGLDGLVGAKYEENISDYGAFELADDEKIINYVEKPEKDSAPSNIKKTSIEIYKNKYIEYLKKPTNHEYPNIAAMISLAQEGNVKIFKIPQNTYTTTLKYSWDILGIMDFINNKMPDDLTGSSYISFNSDNDDDSKITNSNIEESVEIGPGTIIENSLISKDVVIGRNCFISNSIIGPNTKIGDGFKTLLNPGQLYLKIKNKDVKVKREKFGCAISKDVFIGNNVTFQSGTLVGKNNKIDDNSIISGKLEHK